MKIDTGNSQLYATQRAQSPVSARTGAASFSAALTTATAATTKSESETSGVKQADFTSMTRKEMWDWTNDQIRSGEMSLEDGFPLIAMTMKIPVNGGPGGEVPMESDSERIDFTQKVRGGIEGALSRNDQASLKMLESVMATMQQFQGRTIGIDTRA